VTSSKRDRLGRGLGALLGEYLGEGPPGPATQTRPVPVSAIAPNPFQPRREFSEQDLADLTASMRENGLLQPIVVRPRPGPGVAQWELVAGERRWRASMRLGWKEITAVVRDVDDRTLLVLAMVENLQRSELAPLEEADGYRRLADDFSLSQQQIADLVGKDRSTIANSLRLLNLPASVRQLLAEGRLTAGHARALLGLSDERRLAMIAQAAADGGWSVRAVESEVQRVRGPRRKSKNGKKLRDPNERALEEELQRVLGTRARIRRGRGMSGRIEIPFYNAEDFERVFEMISGKSTANIVS
jgi:ParB family chromosome partitioning protein